jgi:hypothetical protein
MKHIAALLIVFAGCLSAASTGVAGKWQLSAKDQYDTPIKAELALQQTGDQWSGSLQGPEGTVQLRNVSFTNGVLVCSLPYEDTDVTLTLKLQGDDILKGTYEAAAGPTGPVEAIRLKQASAVGGAWKIKTVGPEGEPLDAQITLDQKSGAWGGKINVDAYYLDLPLEDVKVEGETVEMRVSTEVGVYAVNAKLNGDKLEGTVMNPDGVKNPLTGTR